MIQTRNVAPRLATVAMMCAISMASTTVCAEEKPYKEGSVWTISMIRVKPGMLDVYLRDVLPVRKKINEEAQKQGLVVSTHVLSGSAMGRDDWDVMFLEEYKNWAAFDGITAKFDAIQGKIIGSEDKQVQIMTKRVEVREIIGDKVMQELITR